LAVLGAFKHVWVTLKQDMDCDCVGLEELDNEDNPLP